jgi:hypothetical protein
MRSFVPAALVFGLICLIATPAVAQDENREMKKDYLVFAGSGVYAIEFAHSVDLWNYFIGAVGWEHMYGETWGVRIQVEPLFMAQGSEEDVFGVGLSHTWLKYFNLENDVRSYLSAAAGMVFFDEEIPVVNSSRFNFTLGIGAGLDFRVGDHDSLQIGYEFAHISNSAIGDRNPGVNGHRGILAWKHEF